MFKIGDYVVYKGDVCQIVDIHHNGLMNNDYYVLIPVDDNTLKIDLPVNNKNGYLRNLITYDELDYIIKNIPSVEVINSPDKLIENEYRRLLGTYNHIDLIKIIKTSYLRNKERIDNKKKISERDNDYLLKAEHRLYNEFGIILGLSFEDTKNYIIQVVESII